MGAIFRNGAEVGQTPAPTIDDEDDVKNMREFIKLRGGINGLFRGLDLTNVSDADLERTISLFEPNADSNNYSYMFAETKLNTNSKLDLTLISQAPKINADHMFYYLQGGAPYFNTKNVVNTDHMYTARNATINYNLNFQSAQYWYYTFEYLKQINGLIKNTSNITKMESIFYFFAGSTIPYFDTSNVSSAYGAFQYSNLIEIPSYDFSNVTDLGMAFCKCELLEWIHCKNIKSSFDISWSKKLSRLALLELFNNMGTARKASTMISLPAVAESLLSDSDLSIITQKGWKYSFVSR